MEDISPKLWDVPADPHDGEAEPRPGEHLDGDAGVARGELANGVGQVGEEEHGEQQHREKPDNFQFCHFVENAMGRLPQNDQTSGREGCQCKVKYLACEGVSSQK